MPSFCSLSLHFARCTPSGHTPTNWNYFPTTGLTRNKDKLEQSISDLEREMEEAGTHSEELKKEFQTIEEQAEEIVEKDTLCQVIYTRSRKLGEQ